MAIKTVNSLRGGRTSSYMACHEDSNCVGCFWKADQQLRKNWETNPEKMQWFADRELKGTWKSEITYEQIRAMYLQSEFQFGTGAGCQAGYCTD